MLRLAFLHWRVKRSQRNISPKVIEQKCAVILSFISGAFYLWSLESNHFRGIASWSQIQSDELFRCIAMATTKVET